MTRPPHPSSSDGEKSPDDSQGDPWVVFGYLVSGVLLYGVLGWFVDRWLGTSFAVGIGIVFGAGLGTYMTWARFGRPGSGPGSTPGSTPGREPPPDGRTTDQEQD